MDYDKISYSIGFYGLLPGVLASVSKGSRVRISNRTLGFRLGPNVSNPKCK